MTHGVTWGNIARLYHAKLLTYIIWYIEVLLGIMFIPEILITLHEFIKNDRVGMYMSTKTKVWAGHEEICYLKNYNTEMQGILD